MSFIREVLNLVDLNKDYIIENSNRSFYHGSAYDFDKFDINKSGTGDGLNKFGYGLYFADTEALAEYYATENSIGKYNTKELSRRAYLFNKIYLTKELPKQDIIYPKFNIGSLHDRWKKTVENNLNDIKNWIDLYNVFMLKSKTSYRFLFSLNNIKENPLRLFSIKSYVLVHTFI